jgi:FtsP/CotA-like multicopper oxidase with cupredoxin domain
MFVPARPSRRAALAGGLALALALVTGRTAAAQTIDPKWLTVNSSAKMVIFQVKAGLNGVNGGYNLNGFTDGNLTLTLPPGWKAVLYFHNAGERLGHHAAVVPFSATPPEGVVTPAFKGAETGAPTYHVIPNGRHTVQFKADAPGQYMLTCTVAGHGTSGMWMRFNVDASATEPTLAAK